MSKDMWVMRLKDEHKEEGMLGDFYHDSSERGEIAEWMWLTQDVNEATLHTSKEQAVEEMKAYEKVMTDLYGPDAMCSFGYTHMMKHFEFVEVEVTDVPILDDEEWAGRKLDELFEVDKFKKLGKENDHVFQTLVFLGEASQKLSIARTILKENNVAVDPVKMKEMLDMQTWVHDFSQYLRSLNEGSI